MSQVDEGMKLTSEFVAIFTYSMQGMADTLSKKHDWPIEFCSAIPARASIESGCLAMKAILDQAGESGKYQSVVMDLAKGVEKAISKIDPERN